METVQAAGLWAARTGGGGTRDRCGEHVKGRPRWLQAGSHRQRRTRLSGRCCSCYRPNGPRGEQGLTSACSVPGQRPGRRGACCVASRKRTVEFGKAYLTSQESTCSPTLVKGLHSSRSIISLLSFPSHRTYPTKEKQTLIPNGFA